jgi:uncharacterized membrane protein
MRATRHQWARRRGWLVPLLYAAGALGVGMVFPRLEHHFLPDLVSTMSAPAAMAICSSISSGMIALTGIVFSLTFVMVQFSATAYSPRLVLWVARDPVMAHALGVFNATFLYSLMLLAWVDRSASGKVPFISGWMVLALLLASMGLFIALIERIGLLQINRMLIFTGDQGRKAIAELYPGAAGAAPAAARPASTEAPVIQTIAHVGRPQAVQAVHLAALVQQATEADVVLEVTVAVGDTVMDSAPLLRVHGARAALDEQALRDAIDLGDERTFEQDPKYALRLVVDIAIRALSPAINDPTTAVQALDQVEDLLLLLGRRDLEVGRYSDRAGRLRLTIPFPAWEDFLRLGLDEICAYGAGSVQVMRRMSALIENLCAVLPAERHAALQHWERRLKASIARSFADAEEKRDASVPDRQGLGLGSEHSPNP